MRIVVIGGTGHIGSYLIPRLVLAGHEVINFSRGSRTPYHDHIAWRSVQGVIMDRTQAEVDGTLESEIQAAKPDVVIDLICYRLQSAQLLVDALRGSVSQLLVCGTTWVHGHSVQVPTMEDQAREPFGDYGIAKAAIEDYLLKEARRSSFPVTVLHPGHITGPGWPPLNPAGHKNLQVFEKLASGKPLTLPNLGLETAHHVHADDVAQGFMQAMNHWRTAVGESFHIVSPAALTLRGYAEAAARWFGTTAKLEFLPWDQWKETVSEAEATIAWDVISHSPNCSIAKAQRLLNYQPRYTSLEAVFDALQWMIARNMIDA